MKILADQNIYKLNELIPEVAELTTFDPNDGLPDLDGYEVLFVRTVTKLNAHTVPNIPKSLRFIGTASSGTNHIDVDYFKSYGVFVEGARGCNANAVAEYVLTALYIWSEKRGINLDSITVGIVGVGAVGSTVERFLKRFGIKYKSYDPPREKNDNGYKSATLEEILNCDVLTFHVPLTETGEFATKHWLGRAELEKYGFSLIINAARGGIVEEKALLMAKNNGTVGDYILDVWENEPNIDPEVCEDAFLATPHIAGYSEQAKIIATQMIVGKCCALLGVTLLVHHTDYDFQTPAADFDGMGFTEILRHITPYKEYDKELRELLDKNGLANGFRDLRVNRKYRFEFPYLRLPKSTMEANVQLKKLFIKTV